MSRNCQSCGAVCSDEEEVCRQCGAVLPPPQTISASKPTGVSVWSMASLIVSVLGFTFYILIFSEMARQVLIPFIAFSLLSVILPPIAKRIRHSKRKKGKVLEIIAIVVGGFNFYMFIFLFTQFPAMAGYFGWILCAIVYKLVS